MNCFFFSSFSFVSKSEEIFYLLNKIVVFVLHNFLLTDVYCPKICLFLMLQLIMMAINS